MDETPKISADMDGIRGTHLGGRFISLYDRMPCHLRTHHSIQEDHHSWRIRRRSSGKQVVCDICCFLAWKLQLLHWSFHVAIRVVPEWGWK